MQDELSSPSAGSDEPASLSEERSAPTPAAASPSEGQTTSAPPATPAPAAVPAAGEAPTAFAADTATLEHMLDLPLEVTVELGRATVQLGEALALQPGSIIELDRLPGEPLDMHINDRVVARGEVVVVNDVLGLRITEILGRDAARR